MESGKPADVIVTMATHERAGLIVLGSRGLGRLKRTFTSTSVSDHVLHRAKCPVVIVRNVTSSLWRNTATTQYLSEFRRQIIFLPLYWFTSFTLHRPLLSVDVSVCGFIVLSVCLSVCLSAYSKCFFSVSSGRN